MNTSPRSDRHPHLRLEPLTPENIDAACDLELRPGQEHLVEPVARSLAEAYVHPDTAWPRVIVDGAREDRIVGFVMAFLDIEFTPSRPGDDIRSGLWRLNIGGGEQGRGYGRFAVDAVAAEIRRRGGTRITVTYKPGAGGPEGFYRKLGFRPTGELSGGETVADMPLA